jgi:hypothetical protein
MYILHGESDHILHLNVVTSRLFRSIKLWRSIPDMCEPCRTFGCDQATDWAKFAHIQLWIIALKWSDGYSTYSNDQANYWSSILRQAMCKIHGNRVHQEVL